MILYDVGYVSLHCLAALSSGLTVGFCHAKLHNVRCSEPDAPDSMRSGNQLMKNLELQFQLEPYM